MRKTSILLALAVLAAITSAVRAEDASLGQKDLTIETRPPAPTHPGRPGLRNAALNVSVMPVGPSTLGVGTPLAFKMASTGSGWGHLYVLDASGRSQLWLENVPVHAGQPISFPRHGLIVRAAPPAGDETILFVVSRRRLPGFAGPGPMRQPLDLQLTHQELRDGLAGKLAAFPRNQWASAEIQIRIHD